MSYILLRQDNVPGVFQINASENLDLVELTKGIEIENLNEPIQLELASDNLTMSDMMEWPYFVVSKKMRDTLDEFGIDNIQYIKAELLEPDSGKVHVDYWFANIIGAVKCVDASRSKYKKLSGSRVILRNFEVDESECHGLSIFRLGESRRLILISNELMEHLSRFDLDGLIFQKTSDFNGKPASSYW